MAAVITRSLFSLAIFAAFVVNSSSDVHYEEKFFDQYVDHFNFKSFGNQTYKQRYLIADQWWAKQKGPIFFYTGNELSIVTTLNNTGFIFDIAPKFQALVIFAEHRYYGVSFPFGNYSFQPEYIGLLTVEQAMADYASLLTALKRTLNATQCPVITFGGSYGGMLSAYMRVKYPHIIDGAIAASAPVYMAALVTPRNFFFEHVTKDFHDINPKCEVLIQTGFIELNALASRGEKGLQTISSMFNLCSPLKNQTDYRHLLLWIRDAFTTLAMMDYPYATDFTANLPAFPVKIACGKIAQATNAAEGLLEIAEMIYGRPKCHSIWDEYVECADPTGCGLGTDSMAWDYQACTEILLPAGTNNVTDMFPNLPFTLEQRQKYCQNRWGVVPRDDWLAIQMFQKGLKGSSNIVFSNGDLDPWMEGGVLNSISDSIVSVIIQGGAHHLDLRGHNPADPKSVIIARQTEALYINKWIRRALKRNKVRI